MQQVIFWPQKRRLCMSIWRDEDPHFDLNHELDQAAHFGYDSRFFDLVKQFEKSKKDGCLTPLHLAAYYNRANWIEALLDRGFDINATAKDGVSPFICAVSGKASSVLPVLKNFGAQLDQVDHVRKTALHHAAWIGFFEGVDFLLQHDVEIDPLDIQGMTPLHWALRGSHFKVAQLLISQSTFYLIPDASGQTPYDLALRIHYQPILDQMKARIDFLLLQTLGGHFDQSSDVDIRRL